MIILTTNLERSIDEAFARRIRFKVAFEEPGPETRRQLWQRLMPKGLRLDAGVDLGALADVFALSGGHIKEAVLRAAALALAEGTGALTQPLLVRSANVEYRKLGKLPVGLSGGSSGAARVVPAR